MLPNYSLPLSLQLDLNPSFLEPHFMPLLTYITTIFQHIALSIDEVITILNHPC
jgi:hypothetical protein